VKGKCRAGSDLGTARMAGRESELRAGQTWGRENFGGLGRQNEFPSELSQAEGLIGASKLYVTGVGMARLYRTGQCELKSLPRNALPPRPSRHPRV
jgi:hypothetical protein